MKNLMQAMEAIDFQSPDFAVLLERLFEEILAKDNNTAAMASVERASIEKATFTQTGIRASLLFTEIRNVPVSISIRPNPNFVLNNQELARAIASTKADAGEKVLKSWGGAGYVDLKRGKVGGDYSKWPSAIAFDLDIVRAVGWSARECAAVYLHELGHVFSSFELIDRTIISNLAMTTIIRRYDEVDGDVNSKLYKSQLKVVGQVVAGDANYYNELSGITDKTTITTVILAKTYKPLESLIGYNDRQRSVDELLADQFSAAYGLGKEIVTALVKVDTAFRSMGKVDSFICKHPLLTIILAIVPPFNILASAFLLGYVVLATLAAFIRAFFGPARSAVSADLYERYTAIRSNEVARLKQSSLSRKEKEEILSVLNDLDAIIGSVKANKSITDSIMRLVSKSTRDANNAYKLQQELQSLSNNQLYVQAARLSTLI